MKIIDYFEKEIKNISGNILGVGIKNDKLINKIVESKIVTEFNLLNADSKNEKNETKIKETKIKNLRKYFKKKKIDVIIYDIDNLKEDESKFIYDTIYIGKSDIYLYTNYKKSIDEAIYKYKRYTKDIEKNNLEDGILYKINIKQIKNNVIKEKIFKVLDRIIYIINVISDTLSE